MMKIKILTVAVILVAVGIVLNGSQRFSTFAETDAADDIVNYKTWTRVTKEPVKVEINMAAVSG